MHLNHLRFQPKDLESGVDGVWEQFSPGDECVSPVTVSGGQTASVRPGSWFCSRNLTGFLPRGVRNVSPSGFTGGRSVSADTDASHFIKTPNTEQSFHSEARFNQRLPNSFSHSFAFTVPTFKGRVMKPAADFAQVSFGKKGRRVGMVPGATQTGRHKQVTDRIS